MTQKNEIHSNVIIDDNVEIGENNVILPNTIIWGPTHIGSNNTIGPNVFIGSPPSDTKNLIYDYKSYVEIGNNNIIREFTTVQKPCYKDITKIGNNIMIMPSVVVPHDAVLYDDVVVAPMTCIAGVSTLMTGVSIGVGVSIHQYSVIGHYAFIAMGSILVKNVKPFTIFVSNRKPAVNEYAIKKFGFQKFEDEIMRYVLDNIQPTSDTILNITTAFDQLHFDSKRKLYS
jgi:UDP-N-acetylglucosamine acyltransferase